MKRKPQIFVSPFGGVEYALALNEKQFKYLKKKLKIVDDAKFLDCMADGQVTRFEGGRKQIVQIGNTDGISSIAVQGLIIHESVHVWQSIRSFIGEDYPSREFEAYSIQRISQDLLWSYQELTK